MLRDLDNWLSSLPSVGQEAKKVACIGNSITDGHGIDMAGRHGYPAQLQSILGRGYDVRNFGVSSRTMLNKGDYPYQREQAWRDALGFCPDVVVIKLGTNDSKPENWKHGDEFEHDLRQMVTALQSLPSRPKIYLCTPIPAFKSTWNISDSTIVQAIIPTIKKVAKAEQLGVIDLHAQFVDNDGKLMLFDGIHPNEKGARRLAEIVAEALKP
jgi:lysophospholipase L1-like esterase